MPSYHLARTACINAPVERVYETIANFKTWTTWSPWLIAEPTSRVVVSPNSSGVGATYAWEGEVVGAGEIEHRLVEPPRLIEDELRFLKPFKSTCQIKFEFEPVREGTQVTWSMDGKMPWFLFWMIPMIKTFIGMDYDRELAMLKDLIETGVIPSKVLVHGSEPTEPLRMAGISGTCTIDQVSQAVSGAFEKARKTFAENDLPLDGSMITVYTRFCVKPGTFDYICGFILPEKTEVPARSGLKTWRLPKCHSFRVQHTGSYRHLGNGWSVANQVVRYSKLKQRREGTFEIYRTTPVDTPENELVTDIYLPLR